MKFEEMKKIWDEQNQEHLYVIDEKRLHDNIRLRKHKGSRQVNQMEWLSIITNLVTGSFLLLVEIIEEKSNVFTNILILVMFGIAAIIYVRHRRRLKHENRFDRTILGDLDHAISNATYQANLSLSLLIYFVVIWIFVFLSALKTSGPIMLIFLGAMFVVFFLLARWEHKAWHLARKKRLIAMKAKLLE